MMEKVQFRINDDYEGHHHAGKLVAPGEVIDVWPHQAAWLQKIGAGLPVTRSRRSRSKSDEPDPEEPSTEGAEESPTEE